MTKSILTGSPVSANRRLIPAKGRLVSSVLYRSKLEEWQWEAKSQYRDSPKTGDVVLDVIIYYPNLKSDLDGSLKLIFDALTGVLYEDDKQITEFTAHKWVDRENPRVEIRLL